MILSKGDRLFLRRKGIDGLLRAVLIWPDMHVRPDRSYLRFFSAMISVGKKLTLIFLTRTRLASKTRCKRSDVERVKSKCIGSDVGLWFWMVSEEWKCSHSSWTGRRSTKLENRILFDDYDQFSPRSFNECATCVVMGERSVAVQREKDYFDKSAKG